MNAPSHFFMEKGGQLTLGRNLFSNLLKFCLKNVILTTCELQLMLNQQKNPTLAFTDEMFALNWFIEFWQWKYVSLTVTIII